LALSLRHSMKVALVLALAVVLVMAAGRYVLPRNYQANLVELMDVHEEGVLDEQAVVSEDFAGGEVPTTTEVKKRWIEWQPALNMVRDNPVLGVGTGGYQLHIGQNYGMLPNFKKIEPDTNCGWLVVAGSMGLCGLIALAALFASQYRAAMRLAAGAASDALRDVSLGLAGSMLGLFLAMLFSNVFVRGLSITVILLLALVTSIGSLGPNRPTKPPSEAD
jgi:O-antigen ligase